MFCRGLGPYGFGAADFPGGGFWYIMMAVRVLIFIGIIIVGVKLYKKYTNQPTSALKTLDERFAKGEIDEEEYIKRKTILSQKESVSK